VVSSINSYLDHTQKILVSGQVVAGINVFIYEFFAVV
jgi:hypothetical protein